MRVPNLHTAPKRHLIKIRTFLRKIIDSYSVEKHKFARRLEGLRPNFLTFCRAIKKTPNKFSIGQLKITFN